MAWNKSKPLGSERYGKDDYIEIKVLAKDYTTAYSKNIAPEGTKWINKHHKVWIDHNGDCIPKRHKIIFLDKNKYNFDINNLLLVPNGIHQVVNAWFKYTEDVELNKAKINLCKLNKEIKDKKNADS